MNQEEMKRMFALLDEEQHRVKEFLNTNNFDCTSAPFVIVRRYRAELKKQMSVLLLNIKEDQ